MDTSKKYNWQRSAIAENDAYVHEHPAFSLVQNSQSSVDLRNYCSQVFDQGQLGSCTGNALVAAVEYLENKDKDFENGDVFVHLSRLFVYYNERSLENTVNEDAGAVITDGVKTLMTVGACSDAVWPYNIEKFSEKPSDEAYNDAQSRKIVAAARVSRNNGIEDIKRVLSSGYPIVFGFTVFSSFEGPEVAQSGVLNMPTDGEQNLGGHAVLMVGYDDSQQRVIVRNSWSDRWGQGGYFTMPYEYVTHPDLADDFWTLTK